jgi:hypothetical protein
VKLQVAPWQTPPTQASPETHAAHTLPPVPQSLSVVPVWHVPDPSQQPVVHVVEHVEALQVPAVQLSPDGHVVHALPPSPHAVVLVPASQKPSASQQPVGHVAGSHDGPLHAPPVQESAGGHGTHAWPPVPHAEVLVPGSQLPKLSQHPVGQLAGLHVTP